MQPHLFNLKHSLHHLLNNISLPVLLSLAVDVRGYSGSAGRACVETEIRTDRHVDKFDADRPLRPSMQPHLFNLKHSLHHLLNNILFGAHVD
jgi:hypothetical protein